MGPAVSEHYGHLTQKMEHQTIGSDLFAPHADKAAHEFLRNISDRRDGEVWGGRNEGAKHKQQWPGAA